MKIWYIHGAHATSRSFIWLQENLPEHEMVNIEYDSFTSVKKFYLTLLEKIAAEPDPINIISHSLGGVLAYGASQKTKNVKKLVTISAPLGGCSVATYLRFLIQDSIMDDIHPYSWLIRAIKGKKPACPIMSIVTSGGRSSIMPEQNDGVVGVASQMALVGPSYVERPMNHFEILLDDGIIDPIKSFIWEN